MRRHASEWAVGNQPRKHVYAKVPKGFASLKAAGCNRRKGARVQTTRGVYDHGTHEEDGPVTWETLSSPWDTFRRYGEPATNLQRTSRQWARARGGKEQALTLVVSRRRGEPERRPKELRESEG
jgi:hypothetical protein